MHEETEEERCVRANGQQIQVSGGKGRREEGIRSSIGDMNIYIEEELCH